MIAIPAESFISIFQLKLTKMCHVDDNEQCDVHIIIIYV